MENKENKFKLRHILTGDKTLKSSELKKLPNEELEKTFKNSRGKRKVGIISSAAAIPGTLLFNYVAQKTGLPLEVDLSEWYNQALVGYGVVQGGIQGAHSSMNIRRIKHEATERNYKIIGKQKKEFQKELTESNPQQEDNQVPNALRHPVLFARDWGQKVAQGYREANVELEEAKRRYKNIKRENEEVNKEYKELKREYKEVKKEYKELTGKNYESSIMDDEDPDYTSWSIDEKPLAEIIADNKPTTPIEGKHFLEGLRSNITPTQLTTDRVAQSKIFDYLKSDMHTGNLALNPVLKLRYLQNSNESSNYMQIQTTFKLKDDDRNVYFLPLLPIEGQLALTDQEIVSDFTTPLFRVDVKAGKGTAVEQYSKEHDMWLTIGKTRLDMVTHKTKK